MARNQTIIAWFTIAIGLILFVYLILTPQRYRKEILQQIWNESTSTSSSTSQVTSLPISSSQIYLKNLEISRDGSLYMITYNYAVKDIYYINEYSFSPVTLKADIFSGSSTATIRFPYDRDRYEMARIMFKDDCPTCTVKMYINGELIYNDRLGKTTFSLNIPEDFLLPNNELKITLLPPSNPFKTVKLTLYDVKVGLLYKKYIERTLKIPYPSNVYLVYDVCPNSPDALEAWVNGHKLDLYTCNPEIMGYPGEDITPYVNSTELDIKVGFRKPIKINKLGVLVKASRLELLFDPPEKDRLLMTVVSGDGELDINTCRFYITSNTYDMNISKCIQNGKNILVLKTDNYLKIGSLIIE